MKNILKFEFHKLFRQKSFYICSGIIVIFSLLSIILTNSVANSNPELITENLSGLNSLLTAITSGNFLLISGIFIALFVCTDYENQTIKNIYSRGFSKTKVYFSKFIVCMCAVIVMYSITLVVSYVSGTFAFGSNVSNVENYFTLILSQVVLVLTYSSFVFSISSIFRKVGTSIAFAVLGPSLISTVLNLLDSFLKIDSFKLSSYWLESFITDLTTISTSTTRIIVCVVLSIIYFAVFVLAGLHLNKKQEI